MSDSLKELVLKKEITELKCYNAYLLFSALGLALQRINYIEQRINEEQKKAEAIEISDEKKPETLDLYVCIQRPNPIDITEIINFRPPRAIYVIESDLSIEGFISNCIWSLKNWENLKKNFQRQLNSYRDLCIKQLDQIREFDLAIRKFPYIENVNNEINHSASVDNLSIDKSKIENLKKDTSSLDSENQSFELLGESEQSSRKISDLEIFDLELPNDLKKMNEWITQLQKAGDKKIKKKIIDKVLELYDTKYCKNHTFIEKSSFLRVVYPFINLKEEWNIKSFIKYALNA